MRFVDFVHRILFKILMKKKVCARWAPHVLSAEQENAGKEITAYHLGPYRHEGDDDFLIRIIAIDETWIHDFQSAKNNEWPRARSNLVKRGQKWRSLLLFKCSRLEWCYLCICLEHIDKQPRAKCICFCHKNTEEIWRTTTTYAKPHKSDARKFSHILRTVLTRVLQISIWLEEELMDSNLQTWKVCNSVRSNCWNVFTKIAYLITSSHSRRVT